MNLNLSEILSSVGQTVSLLIHWLPRLLAALIVILLAHVIGHWLAKRVQRVVELGGRSVHAGIVMARLTRVSILLLGLLIAALIAVPNISAHLVSILGLASVALGFVLRDILADFASGVLILLGEPFKIGDGIIFGAYEGVVEDIRVQNSSLRTYDGQRVVIPNSELVTNAVTVTTAYPRCRSQCDLGIDYAVDIAQARGLILEAVSGVAEVAADPAPDVLVIDLATTGVTLRARWWTTPERSVIARARDHVLAAITRTLAEEGIMLDRPTEVVIRPTAAVPPPAPSAPQHWGE